MEPKPPLKMADWTPDRKDGEFFSFDLLVSLAIYPLHIFLTLNSGGRWFAGSYHP